MSINVMRAKPVLRVFLKMEDQPSWFGDHGRYPPKKLGSTRH